MQKLTLEQAIIVSGYTGFLCCNFSDLHQDVEKRIGHPVWTHQFADKEMRKKIEALYKDDFIAICTDDTPKERR